MPGTCQKRAPDVRTFWVFGLQGQELWDATRCKRPAGHRGKCTRFPKRVRVTADAR